MPQAFTIALDLPATVSYATQNHIPIYTVDFAWTAPSSGGPVNKYDLIRDGNLIATLGSAQAMRYSLQLTDRTPSTYLVEAVGPGGSTRCAPETYPVQPGPPQAVTITPSNGGKSLQLDWKPPSAGGEVTQYAVYRDGELVQTRWATDALTYVDPNGGTKRMYTVHAVGLGGDTTSEPAAWEPENPGGSVSTTEPADSSGAVTAVPDTKTSASGGPTSDNTSGPSISVS